MEECIFMSSMTCSYATHLIAFTLLPTTILATLLQDVRDLYYPFGITHRWPLTVVSKPWSLTEINTEHKQDDWSSCRVSCTVITIQKWIVMFVTEVRDLDSFRDYNQYAYKSHAGTKVVWYSWLETDDELHGRPLMKAICCRTQNMRLICDCHKVASILQSRLEQMPWNLDKS